MITGFLRELGRPRRFHRSMRMGRPEPTNSNDPRLGVRGRGEQTTGANDGIAKRRKSKRGRKGGRESEHP